MRVLANVTGLVLALMIVTVIGAVTWHLSTPAIEIERQAITNRGAEAHRGRALYVSFAVTRYRSCPATVYQWIFDSRDVQFAAAPIAVPARSVVKHDLVTLDMEVPGQAALGPARYQVAVTNKCDFLGLWPIEKRTVMPYLQFDIATRKKRVEATPPL